MKILSILAYVVGSLLLLTSCFIEDVVLTWWLGAISVVFLIAGCILQFHTNKPLSHTYAYHRHGHHTLK